MKNNNNLEFFASHTNQLLFHIFFKIDVKKIIPLIVDLSLMFSAHSSIK